MGRHEGAWTVATSRGETVGRDLRTLFNVGSIRELGDGQLLERFATGAGEGAELAFAALVERHGGMVLRVCRGVLADPHDAHDAFQATFLVLVARGRGLWVRDSIGPWLHRVASRTASKLRAGVIRRRTFERRAAVPEEFEPRPADDLARVLLEELDRLPERFRAPVVLCDLEGQTHEQAARSLGWPVGTVKSRQARARDRLRDRLRRRGVAPGLAPLAGWSASGVSLPAKLVEQTTVAAVRHVATRAIAPGTVAALAREVVRSMTILRWGKAASVVALGAGLVASGTGLVASQGLGDGPKTEAQVAPATDKGTVEVKPGKFTFNLVERGKLEPSRSTDVLNQVEGNRVIIMIKPDGSVVKKDDVVAELDASSLRDRLVNQKIGEQQAEAAYKQAKLVREVAEYAIKEYLEGVFPQDLETYHNKVAAARTDIDQAKARLERTKLARKRFDEADQRRAGPETPADVVADLLLADRLDEVGRDIARAKAELEEATGRQKTLEMYTRQKLTKQLQVDVEKAKSMELDKLSVWSLEQTNSHKLEKQIQACTLRAPASGLLVYANFPRGIRGGGQVQIEEGATVRERQKLFSISDPADPMRVNVKVHEAIVDQLKPGNRVRVRVDALADQTLTGSVLSIAPMADVTRSADAPKVYTTFVGLDPHPDFNLRPGMQARAEIVLNELDDVLSVPVSAVVILDGKDGVAVKTPGGVEWRGVTLGPGNGEVVVVKQGLKPGEVVALDPVRSMREERKHAAKPAR